MRHIQRYRDIALALSRYGFGYIAMELGLTELLSIPKRLFSKNNRFEHRQSSTGERLRLLLEELGPTFIKLGQFASTRSDIFPKDMILEMEKLQDDVPAFPAIEAKKLIELELGKKITDIFLEFHDEPLAAASIGQVHYGVLHSGEQVAIKVQRPLIEQMVKTDLDILKNIVDLACQKLKWAAQYQLKEIYEEFSNSLKAELNYTVEGRNAEKMARQFKNHPNIHIPRIYWTFTTQKILAMEYIEGIKLNDQMLLQEKQCDKRILAERLVHAMFQQIFIDGFFHGDPHPGNIFALPGEKLLFLDFGSVGQILPDMQKQLSYFLIALMSKNTNGIIKAITNMGIINENVQVAKLKTDIERLKIKYTDTPLGQIVMSEAIHDFFSITNKHHIKLPSDLALLGKTLLTLEGIIERLDPDLSITKMAEPFSHELIKQRLHPKALANSLFDELLEYGEILTEFPETVRELKSVIKKGKIQVEISVPAIDRSFKKMDQVSNRLSFSIVLLSFSIIMTGLIIGSALLRQSTMLWNIPVIEIGFMIAILMFILMIYIIFRSGRF